MPGSSGTRGFEIAGEQDFVVVGVAGDHAAGAAARSSAEMDAVLVGVEQLPERRAAAAGMAEVGRAADRKGREPPALRVRNRGSSVRIDRRRRGRCRTAR